MSFTFEFRIERKKKKQLAISKIQAIPVISLIPDISLNYEILSYVKTTRQNPNNFEEVFRICCDLFGAIKSEFIDFNFLIEICMSNLGFLFKPESYWK